MSSRTHPADARGGSIHELHIDRSPPNLRTAAERSHQELDMGRDANQLPTPSCPPHLCTPSRPCHGIRRRRLLSGQLAWAPSALQLTSLGSEASRGSPDPCWRAFSVDAKSSGDIRLTGCRQNSRRCGRGRGKLGQKARRVVRLSTSGSSKCRVSTRCSQHSDSSIVRLALLSLRCSRGKLPSPHPRRALTADPSILVRPLTPDYVSCWASHFGLARSTFVKAGLLLQTSYL